MSLSLPAFELPSAYLPDYFPPASGVHAIPRSCHPYSGLIGKVTPGFGERIEDGAASTASGPSVGRQALPKVSVPRQHSACLLLDCLRDCGSRAHAGSTTELPRSSWTIEGRFMGNLEVAAGGDHHRITPTARMVAYFRSFSDIPYATDTANALRCEESVKFINHDDLVVVTRFLGPFLEARYKCFNKFVRAYRNVLELAVGTSIERGLSISDDADRMYIGTDLPEMIEESRAFFLSINKKERLNHRLEAASVLSCDELSAAAGDFGGRRGVLIVNEGLLQYLSLDERHICAANVRRILERYGGEWITPDVNIGGSGEDPSASVGPEAKAAIGRVFESVSNMTGRDNEKNSFGSPEEAVRFFHESGFEVNQYPMIESVKHLSSISKLWREQERCYYEPLLNQQRVWVMSLR